MNPLLPVNLLSLQNGRLSKENLEEICKEMESLFLYELFKTMRRTVDLTGKSDFQKDTYNTIVDIYLSRTLAKKGLGLEKLLFKQLSKNLNFIGSFEQKNSSVRKNL